MLEYVDLSEVDGFTEIPQAAFNEVLTIKTMMLPKAVTAIGYQAFCNMPALQTITLPDSLVSIDGQAFMGDTLLQAATLPAKLESVGENAFMNCKACGPELQIPASLSQIGLGAFTYMKAVKTISVEQGNKAYKTDGSALYTADGKTLLMCAGALEGPLKVADGTTAILANAFAGAEKVTSVSLPASVEEVGEYAFDFMFGLESIDVDPANDYYSSQDGVLFDKAKETLIIYPQGAKAEQYATPSTVVTIGTAAFANNTHLKAVALNEGIANLNDYAFNEATALEAVTLPSTIEVMGASAFTYCTSLKEATMLAPVAYLPDYTFGGCTLLETVNLPDGIEEIGISAFQDCSSLTAIALPPTLVNIYNGAFQSTGLNEITLPEGFLALDINTFSYSASLKDVNLPSTITSIGGSSFDGTALANVKCDAKVPPMADYAFMLADLANAKLTVPEGSEDAYKQAEGWKDFPNIVATGINTVASEPGNKGHKAIYGIDGVKLDKMRRGLNIVGGKAVLKK